MRNRATSIASGRALRNADDLWHFNASLAMLEWHYKVRSIGRRRVILTIKGIAMSHTDVEQHHGYSVHATSEKHDNGKWVGSFHIARQSYPVISISAVQAAFDSADAAAAYALQQGKLYIDEEMAPMIS